MKPIVTANTFADLYTTAANMLVNDYDYETSPRGMKIHEVIDAIFVLSDPTKNLFRCPSDKSITMPTAYTKKEICLYLAGYDNADLFTQAAPFWGTIKTDNNKINSAYGNLIFNESLEDGRSQFEWAYESLASDKDSRQAFMRFNNTSHQYNGNKDLPCTFIEIFHIRDNKLFATVMMRSNDIVSGLIHDLPSFTLFQYLMYLRLKETNYPDLELGTYTHIASSFHLYEKDFELTEKRLNAGLASNQFPMPQNWRVIKSTDINKIIDKKFRNIEIEGNWEYPENSEFYNWLLK